MQTNNYYYIQPAIMPQNTNKVYTMLNISVKQITDKATTEIHNFTVKATKDATKEIASGLKTASETASKLNLTTSVKVFLTMDGKTVSFPFTSNFKTLNFAVLLQLASLTFDKFESSMNANVKSNNSLLIFIAAKFGYKAEKEISFVEYTRTIKNRLKILNAAITVQTVRVDRVTMTKNDIAVIKAASDERKAYKAELTAPTKN